MIKGPYAAQGAGKLRRKPLKKMILRYIKER